MISSLGKTGEELAIKFLTISKFKIIKHNYSCPLGEIDIIANHNDILYFIEVKTRSSDQYGGPFAAVDYKKQQKISRIAAYYLMTERYLGDTQYGVIGIMYNSYTKRYKLDFLTNAFEHALN